MPETSSLPKAKKKRGAKKIIFGLFTVIIVLAVLAFMGGGGTETELSEYIPLAQKDVMKFVKKNGLEEISKDFMYSDDNLIITLNDNGNIDTLIIEGPQYSLYEMKVGNDFSLEKDGKRLTEHNYGFLGEYGERIVYGVSGRDTPGGDRLIAITLTSDGNIGKLEFMKSGAQDIIDEGNKENSLSTDENLELNSIEENEVLSGYAESHMEETQENIAVGANEDEGYILPDSSSRYLTNEDLSGLDKAELRLARNEIYAKHGRKFETEDLNQYFSSQLWYSGYLSADEFDDSVLNGFERANLDLIKSVEGLDNSLTRELASGFYLDVIDNTISLEITIYEERIDGIGIGMLELSDGVDTFFLSLIDNGSSAYTIINDNTGENIGSITKVSNTRVKVDGVFDIGTVEFECSRFY